MRDANKILLAGLFISGAMNVHFLTQEPQSPGPSVEVDKVLRQHWDEVVGVALDATGKCEQKYARLIATVMEKNPTPEQVKLISDDL